MVIVRKYMRNPIHAISSWVARKPPKVKEFPAIVTTIITLVILKFVVHNNDNLFIVAEATHAMGISVLVTISLRNETMLSYHLKLRSLLLYS